MSSDILFDIPIIGGPMDGGTYATPSGCLRVGFIMRVAVDAPVEFVGSFDPNIYHKPAYWIYTMTVRNNRWCYELKGNNIG